jgi:hypothetical protein
VKKIDFSSKNKKKVIFCEKLSEDTQSNIYNSGLAKDSNVELAYLIDPQLAILVHP